MIRHNILENEAAAKKFAEAVWALKDPTHSPWPNQQSLSLYDFFVFWHHRAMMLQTPPGNSGRNAAHGGPIFLPWHRYMLMRFETMLGEAIGDQDFRLPYWDWSKEADNLTGSAIFTENYLGQFLEPAFEVRFGQNSFGNAPLPLVNPRSLRRYVGSIERDTGTTQDIKTIIAQNPDYDAPPYNGSSNGFRGLLEGSQGLKRLHNRIHVVVGGVELPAGQIRGDMLLSTSPNDPAFFLHHCFVDKIWAAWQERWPTSEYLPDQQASDEFRFHRLKDPMHTFFNETVRAEQMLDVSQDYQYDRLDDLL